MILFWPHEGADWMIASIVTVVLFRLLLRRYRANWTIGTMIVGLFAAYVSTELVRRPIVSVPLGDDPLPRVYPASSFQLMLQQVLVRALTQRQSESSWADPMGPP